MTVTHQASDPEDAARFQAGSGTAHGERPDSSQLSERATDAPTDHVAPSDMTVAPRGAPREVWLEIEAALDEYIKDWVSHLVLTGPRTQQPPEPEPPSQAEQDREIRAAIDALVLDGAVERAVASMAVSLAVPTRDVARAKR